MLCEKCGREVESATCSKCAVTIIRLGRFCYQCGQELEKRAEEPHEDTGYVDFSSRVLCSDGTCIGIINEQGVCKVCGKPYSPES